MTYEVQVLPRAKCQLYDAALWWAEHRSTEQAVQSRRVGSTGRSVLRE